MCLLFNCPQQTSSEIWNSGFYAEFAVSGAHLWRPCSLGSFMVVLLFWLSGLSSYFSRSTALARIVNISSASRGWGVQSEASSYRDSHPVSPGSPMSQALFHTVLSPGELSVWKWLWHHSFLPRNSMLRKRTRGPGNWSRFHRWEKQRSCFINTVSCLTIAHVCTQFKIGAQQLSVKLTLANISGVCLCVCKQNLFWS